MKNAGILVKDVARVTCPNQNLQKKPKVNLVEKMGPPHETGQCWQIPSHVVHSGKTVGTGMGQQACG